MGFGQVPRQHLRPEQDGQGPGQRLSHPGAREEDARRITSPGLSQVGHSQMKVRHNQTKQNWVQPPFF